MSKYRIYLSFLQPFINSIPKLIFSTPEIMEAYYEAHNVYGVQNAFQTESCHGKHSRGSNISPLAIVQCNTNYINDYDYINDGM
jgi:hypothetical protein